MKEKNYLEDVKLNLSEQELARVISEYYHSQLTFKTYVIKAFKKGWGINAGLFLANNLQYDQILEDVKLPERLIIKQYRPTIMRSLFGKSNSRYIYRKEKEIYKFANRHAFYRDENKQMRRTFVRCYNDELNFLDEKKVLVLDYGGLESEAEIIKLGLEINNLEQRIKAYNEQKRGDLAEECKKTKERVEGQLENILRLGLNTTALFHIKSAENEEELISLDQTKPKGYYHKLLGYLEIIFKDKIKELSGELRSKFLSSIEKLAEFYSGDKKSNILLRITHGDLHNRNILIDENNRALFVGGGHVKRALSSLDVAEQLINDVVYLPLNELEEIIIKGYLKEKSLYKSKFKIENKQPEENFFIGASMISSFIKILKATAFTQKVKKEIPDQYELLLINEPPYRLTEYHVYDNPVVRPKDMAYNLKILEKVIEYALENSQRFHIDYLAKYIENFKRGIEFLSMGIKNNNSYTRLKNKANVLVL